MPLTYIRLKERLRRMAQLEGLTSIPWSVYKKTALNCGVAEGAGVKAATDLLHDMGVLHYFRCPSSMCCRWRLWFVIVCLCSCLCLTPSPSPFRCACVLAQHVCAPAHKPLRPQRP